MEGVWEGKEEELKRETEKEGREDNWSKISHFQKTKLQIWKGSETRITS